MPRTRYVLTAEEPGGYEDEGIQKFRDIFPD